MIFSHHHPSLSSIQPLKLEVVQSDNKKAGGHIVVSNVLYEERRWCWCSTEAPPRSASNLPDKNRSQKMLKHFGIAALLDPPEAQVRGALVFLLSFAVSNACKVKLVKAH